LWEGEGGILLLATRVSGIDNYWFQNLVHKGLIDSRSNINNNIINVAFGINKTLALELVDDTQFNNSVNYLLNVFNCVYNLEVI